MKISNIRNPTSRPVAVPRTLWVLVLLAVAAISLNRAEAKPPGSKGRNSISLHVFGSTTDPGDVATVDLYLFRESRVSDVTVTVYYSTIDGWATVADGDYLPASGTLTFSPGESHKTVAVQTLPDLYPEYDEDFWLRASDTPTTTSASSGASCSRCRRTNGRKILPSTPNSMRKTCGR
jgi:hypothetical protein